MGKKIQTAGGSLYGRASLPSTTMRGTPCESDQFDLYGGLMLGYNIGAYKDKSTRTGNGITEDYSDDYRYRLSYVTWSTYVGGRYLFTERLGAYLEVGYGVSYLNLG